MTTGFLLRRFHTTPAKVAKLDFRCQIPMGRLEAPYLLVLAGALPIKLSLGDANIQFVSDIKKKIQINCILPLNFKVCYDMFILLYTCFRREPSPLRVPLPVQVSER